MSINKTKKEVAKLAKRERQEADPSHPDSASHLSLSVSCNPVSGRDLSFNPYRSTLIHSNGVPVCLIIKNECFNKGEIARPARFAHFPVSLIKFSVLAWSLFLG